MMAVERTSEAFNIPAVILWLLLARYDAKDMLEAAKIITHVERAGVTFLSIIFLALIRAAARIRQRVKNAASKSRIIKKVYHSNAFEKEFLMNTHCGTTSGT
jgi:hypothetical protein